MATIAFVAVLFLSAAIPSAAKSKDRAWQTGILTDSSSESGTRIAGTANGVITLRNDLTYYQIDGGSIVYVVARSLRRRGDKALDVTINGHVQFAIEGSTCYLKDDAGKEHTLSVEKKIAKQP